MPVKKIVLRHGPGNGTRAETDGGDYVYVLEKSIALHGDQHLLNPDGSYNDAAFAGNFETAYRYIATGEFDDGHEIFDYVGPDHEKKFVPVKED